MQNLDGIKAVSAGAILGALAYIVFPWADLNLSGLFYDSERGFWLTASPPALLVYFGVIWGMRLIAVALLAGLLWALFWPSALARCWRRPMAFLVLTLALGPGLITHSVLKEGFGRPRPIAISDFGGKGHYVPPGIVSDQCTRNCSFVSGHAASGFFLIALAWVFPMQRRRWMLIGIATGSVIGLTRIIQGDHFFSDIFFSYWVVWLTAVPLAWLLKPRYAPPA